MHPMFVKLFLETDSDDLLASEEETRQHPNRAKRGPARKAIKVAARPQDHRSRR